MTTGRITGCGDGAAGAVGVCWDLGDVIFSEETEVKTDDGLTLSVTLVPGVRQILVGLAERGVPMAIVSDTRIGACQNVLGPHGLEHCFSGQVVSEALGYQKPDIRMFQSAGRALGLPLRRLAMVGNHYQRDVEGAKRAGMTTIWFHWNDRYPHPPVAPAADYEARDAAELREAVEDWLRSGR